MRYERLTSRDWAKNKYAVPSYKSLAELEDKIEQGELVSLEWHNEQILHAEQEIERLKFYVQELQDNFNRIKNKRIEKLEQIRETILKNGDLVVDVKNIDEMIERIARNLE